VFSKFPDVTQKIYNGRGDKMSILLNILISAAGCFIAIIAFIFMIAIFDCIYNDL
jgi:hypothetical protein